MPKAVNISLICPCCFMGAWPPAAWPLGVRLRGALVVGLVGRVVLVARGGLVAVGSRVEVGSRVAVGSRTDAEEPFTGLLGAWVGGAVSARCSRESGVDVGAGGTGDGVISGIGVVVGAGVSVAVGAALVA